MKNFKHFLMIGTTLTALTTLTLPTEVSAGGGFSKCKKGAEDVIEDVGEAIVNIGDWIEDAINFAGSDSVQTTLLLLLNSVQIISNTVPNLTPEQRHNLEQIDDVLFSLLITSQTIEGISGPIEGTAAEVKAELFRRGQKVIDNAVTIVKAYKEDFKFDPISLIALALVQTVDLTEGEAAIHADYYADLVGYVNQVVDARLNKDNKDTKKAVFNIVTGTLNFIRTLKGEKGEDVNLIDQIAFISDILMKMQTVSERRHDDELTAHLMVVDEGIDKLDEQINEAQHSMLVLRTVETSRSSLTITDLPDPHEHVEEAVRRVHREPETGQLFASVVTQAVGVGQAKETFMGFVEGDESSYYSSEEDDGLIPVRPGTGVEDSEYYSEYE